MSNTMPVTDSSPRLVLFLSGKWDAKQSTQLRASDQLFRSPDAILPDEQNGPDWQTLPRASVKQIAEKCAQYSMLFQGHEDELVQKEFFSLSNNHFIYGVLAVAGQLEKISELIHDCKPSQILVFSAKAPNGHVPAIGFANSESSLGTKDIIGALVAEIVYKQTKSVPVKWHLLKGDPLISDTKRRLFFKCASSLLILTRAIQLLIAGRTKQPLNKGGITHLIFVRTSEQARHAIRLFAGAPNTHAIVTPQFLGGNPSVLLKQLGDNRINAYLPSKRAILLALWGTLFKRRPKYGTEITKIDSADYQFDVGLNVLRQDYQALKLFEFQRLLLKHTLACYSDATVSLGFEIQGPMAWIEGCEPRKASITSRTIQPAVVQIRPLPIFPMSKEFFVDSQPNQQHLNQIGSYKLGNSLYAGTPFRVKPVPNRSKFTKIGYFTQPYEFDSTATILKKLCEYAIQNDAEIRVRLHPRDKGLQLNSILRKYSGHCRIYNEPDMGHFLDDIDLCVTRTSSVTKEALSQGCAVVNVLLTEFDKAMQTDFLAADLASRNHIAISLDDFDQLLQAPAEISRSSRMLQNQLFGALDFNDFIQRVGNT